MKKAIACLLALPLTLAACGAQTTQPAPTQAPEVTTEATTENGESTPGGRQPAGHHGPDAAMQYQGGNRRRTVYPAFQRSCK